MSHVPLRDYVDKQLANAEKRLDQRIDALKELAETVDRAMKELMAALIADLKERMATMNEFRKSLEDLSARMVLRDMYDSDRKGDAKAFSELRDTVSKMVPRRQYDENNADIDRRFKKLEATGNVTQGKEAQKTDSKAFVFALAAVVFSILGLVISKFG